MERAGGRKLSFTRTSRAYRFLLLHPVRLIRRLLAEHASPRSLGAAAALGIVVGASPFLGLHTLLVVVLAGRLRLNRLMALATNQLCMPPIVPALCIEVGYYLRHGAFLTEVSLRTLGSEALERFWEWLLGSLLVGPALAAVVGAAVWLFAELQRRRGVPDASSDPCGDRTLAPEDNGESAAAGKSEKATPAGQP
jgi:uncharacterized protein (DUF2062 family)